MEREVRKRPEECHKRNKSCKETEGVSEGPSAKMQEEGEPSVCFNMNGLKTEVCTNSEVEPVNKVDPCTDYFQEHKCTVACGNHVGCKTDLSYSADHFPLCSI